MELPGRELSYKGLGGHKRSEPFVVMKIGRHRLIKEQAPTTKEQTTTVNNKNCENKTKNNNYLKNKSW